MGISHFMFCCYCSVCLLHSIRFSSELVYKSTKSPASIGLLFAVYIWYLYNIVTKTKMLSSVTILVLVNKMLVCCGNLKNLLDTLGIKRYIYSLYQRKLHGSGAGKKFSSISIDNWRSLRKPSGTTKPGPEANRVWAHQ